MDEILDLAAKLGKRIAEDPRAKAMSAATAGLDGSLEDRQLLSDYQQQQHKLAALQAANKPIEPEDKRKLADLHGKVVGSSVIKAITKAQADYLALMTAVTRKIEHESLGRT